MTESRDNATDLYQIVHDYIKQNPMDVQDVIGLMMAIMLEFAIGAYNSAQKAIDEEEDEEDE